MKNYRQAIERVFGVDLRCEVPVPIVPAPTLRLDGEWSVRHEAGSVCLRHSAGGGFAFGAVGVWT